MNNTKKISSKNFFFFICLLALIFPFSCKANSSLNGETTKSKKSPHNLTIKKDMTIIVYYFHTTYRCNSCNKIEAFTKTSLEKNFINHLKNKKIIFKLTNIDKSDNKHFVKDYQLFTKSVVISKNIKDKEVKWRRLDKTWEFLHKPKDFDQYIKNEIINLVKE